MGGEVYELMNEFNMAYVILIDLRKRLGRALDIIMLTNSKKLFEAITCGKRTEERRLKVDVSSARQIYLKFDSIFLGLVRAPF